MLSRDVFSFSKKMNKLSQTAVIRCINVKRCYTITLILSELIIEGQFGELEPIFEGFLEEFNRETDLVVKVNIAQIRSVEVGGVSFLEEPEIVVIRP